MYFKIVFDVDNTAEIVDTLPSGIEMCDGGWVKRTEMGEEVYFPVEGVDIDVTFCMGKTMIRRADDEMPNDISLDFGPQIDLEDYVVMWSEEAAHIRLKDQE